MDCLADTGANIFLLIAIATGLSVVAALGIYLSSRYKRNFKYIASVLIFMIGVLGIGVLPSSSVNAASNNTQCGDSSKNVTPSSSSTSNNSDDDSTPTPAQKLWNVPFTSGSDWDDFTNYNFSTEGGPMTFNLTASGGTGKVAAVQTGTPGGNNRNLFVYNPAGESKDGEVRALIQLCDATCTNVTQAGLVLRASDLGNPVHQRTIIAWTNVISYGLGTTIAGLWQGNMTTGGSFYSHNGAYKEISVPITSLTADGTTATVQLSEAINSSDIPLSQIDINGVDASVDGTYAVTVVGAEPSNTVQFATTANGSWSGGSMGLALNNKRWIAARVIGDQMTIKHWLPGHVEPSWSDPSNIYWTIPAVINGEPVPTQGKFGIIFAHGLDGDYVDYTGLQFKSLDP